MMVAKIQPPRSGRPSPAHMRASPLFRRALRLDIAHVTVFIVRALTFRTHANPEARSARSDAVVAAAGLSLAVVAFRRDARAAVTAGLLLNTAGCAVTLIRHTRHEPHPRPMSCLWTAYLLAGGNAVSLAYLAAGSRPDSHR
jgi:hypothetical protein